MESAYGKEQGQELRKLAEVIADPGHRKAFARDPDETLARMGVDVDKLPEAVRNTLYDLSYEELRAVSRVRASLLEAGVSRDDLVEIF